MILRIVIGVALLCAGAYMVIRTNGMIGFFGTVDWAEAKMGSGGTYLFYKLFGIFIIFVGFIVATNLWNAFLQATLGSLLPSGQK